MFLFQPADEESAVAWEAGGQDFAAKPRNSIEVPMVVVNVVPRTWLFLLKCLTFLTQVSFLDRRNLPPNEFHSRTGTFPQDKV